MYSLYSPGKQRQDITHELIFIHVFFRSHRIIDYILLIKFYLSGIYSLSREIYSYPLLFAPR